MLFRKILQTSLILLSMLIFLNISSANALMFSLSSPDQDIVGNSSEYVVEVGDNLSDIRQHFEIGYFELEEANPDMDFHDFKAGLKLYIPTQFILPNVPRKGIIINLSELRLYYFPKDSSVVYTFPVGIGRKRSETPLVVTKIVKKEENPTWTPTDNTREEAVEKGVMLPKRFKTGPDNPLGFYAMRLALPNYLIHGTNDPTGVGIRSSGGCIRMYPENVKELFDMVEVGTQVRIIDQPYKIGWDGDQLEMEVHVPLNHRQNDRLTPDEIKSLGEFITTQTKGSNAVIDWDTALAAAQERYGVPTVIGYRKNVMDKKN